MCVEKSQESCVTYDQYAFPQPIILKSSDGNTILPIAKFGDFTSTETIPSGYAICRTKENPLTDSYKIEVNSRVSDDCGDEGCVKLNEDLLGLGAICDKNSEKCNTVLKDANCKATLFASNVPDCSDLESDIQAKKHGFYERLINNSSVCKDENGLTGKVCDGICNEKGDCVTKYVIRTTDGNSQIHSFAENLRDLEYKCTPVGDGITPLSMK